jgi:uncharacterized phage protein (TIGR02218 family)
MAFDTYEESQEGSRPVELYKITVGSTLYRYTSAEDSVTDGADVYVPIAISRSKLANGGPKSSSSNGITIELPGSDVVAQKYIVGIPGELATIEVIRFQREDSSTVTIFDGSITSATFIEGGRTCKMDVVPTTGAISRKVPRFRYSGLCNHVLYDARCQVDDTSPSFRLSAAPVSAESGRTITVTGASANGNGFYTGGFVENSSGSDKRLILDQTGEVLTLMLAFTESVLATNVIVFAGCDHTIQVCDSKFSNVVNFGGFAFVPTKDIWTTGLTQ